MQPKTINQTTGGPPSSPSELDRAPVVLSKAGFEAMQDILENPPKPSPALLRLAAAYNKATA